MSPRRTFLSLIHILSFIKKFVLASGSLKEVAGIYGVTYPTVRLRLDRLIQKIRLGEQADEELSLIHIFAVDDRVFAVRREAVHRQLTAMRNVPRHIAAAGLLVGAEQQTDALGGGKPGIPVSYTHLDVYKRQNSGCLVCHDGLVRLLHCAHPARAQAGQNQHRNRSPAGHFPVYLRC